MSPANDGMLPAPLATLDAIVDIGDTSEKPVKVFIGHNLGNKTFIVQLPMHEFFSMSEVANDPGRDGDSVAQRKLDPVHASKLASYMLKGLISAAIERRIILKRSPIPALDAFMTNLGKQPYMGIQPIVVNIRACNPAGADIRGDRMLDSKTNETAAYKIFLSSRHILWVVDGQHRRWGMQMIFEFLDFVRRNRVYPKKSANVYGLKDGEAVSSDELQAWEECFEVARSYCTLIAEVHLGLMPEEERQLFHDLNRLGKKVDNNLALQFDSSNPVNLFIKEELIGKLNLKVSESEVKDWSTDDGSISRKDLVAVNAVLFLNKTNISGSTPAMIEGKTEVAYQFWTAVSAIQGFGEQGAREATVAAQPVVLKALAKLTYDFCFSPRRTDEAEILGAELISRLTDIDFGHDNMMWRYYELNESERKEHGLEELAKYLPSDTGANRDLGSFQNGVMRFGAKHNDIYPILGDMIRWKLGFPPRKGSQALDQAA
jgi:hypothetical protein